MLVSQAGLLPPTALTARLAPLGGLLHPLARRMSSLGHDKASLRSALCGSRAASKPARSFRQRLDWGVLTKGMLTMQPGFWGSGSRVELSEGALCFPDKADADEAGAALLFEGPPAQLCSSAERARAPLAAGRHPL